MGTIVVKNACVRRPGYMYYISKEGHLMEALMSHGGRKKGSGKKKKAAKPARKAVLKKLIKKVTKKVTKKKK